MHGGTSSVGAQIRRRRKPIKLRLRDESGHQYIDKPTSYHAFGATADYPAFGEGVPAKGGTQGYMCDRLSNLDSRSMHYGKPSSLLRKNDPSVPSYFERRTRAGVDEAVKEAAGQRTIEDIKNVLNNNGLCYDNFIFDRNGGYKDNYALSSDLFDGLDWIRACEPQPPPVTHALTPSRHSRHAPWCHSLAGSSTHVVLGPDPASRLLHHLLLYSHRRILLQA